MTANMVPVCSMTSSSVICGVVGSSPRSFIRDDDVGGAGDGQQLREALDDGQEE